MLFKGVQNDCLSDQLIIKVSCSQKWGGGRMIEEEEEVGPPGDHGQRTTGHHRHTISLTMYNRGDNITSTLHYMIK